MAGIPRSLRVRLLLGAAIAIFLALAAAWVAMTLLFERHVERRIQADLIREGLQLAAALSIAPDGTPELEQEPGDSRFFEPASGLYWQVSTSKGTLSSRSLWDQQLPAPKEVSASQWHRGITDGPFDQRMLLVERIIRPEPSGSDVLVQVAHEQKSLHEAREEFGQELALFLALLWLILAAAGWIQVELGLRPLRHVRNEVAMLKRNPRERMAAAPVAEIEPLTRAINELAEAREHDLGRARRRAADLAHGLKTPLAALSAQSRRAREAGAIEAADGLDHAIAAATAAIEAELARSRVAAIRAAPTGDSTVALPLLESLVGVVDKTEFGARLVFEVDVPEDLRLPVAGEYLLEIAGALIENAARYARRRVRITAEATGAGSLIVEDDGPGIDPENVAAALTRGRRLDEAGPGHGLGLAVANDLVDATRGQITLLRSELGGLKVTVAW